MSNNKLTAFIDSERYKRDLVKEHDGLEVGFTLRSDQRTDNYLLQHYRNRFPEVFDVTLRSKAILHSVEAIVEVRHNKIVHSVTNKEIYLVSVVFIYVYSVVLFCSLGYSLKKDLFSSQLHLL